MAEAGSPPVGLATDAPRQSPMSDHRDRPAGSQGSIPVTLGTPGYKFLSCPFIFKPPTSSGFPPFYYNVKP